MVILNILFTINCPKQNNTTLALYLKKDQDMLGLNADDYNKGVGLSSRGKGWNGIELIL